MIENHGENNQVALPVSCMVKNSKVVILGNNNTIMFGECCKINSCNIRLKGNNIHLYIGNNVELTGLICSMFVNTSLSIGDSSTLGKGEITIAEENTLEIGKDCMFAHGFEIRTSDMHPIYSLGDGKIINSGKDIKIGNHIWLGRDVVILKGVHLADNIVVGIRSVVTKSFLVPNSILAGLPAKVVGSDIVWGRKMYYRTMFDDPSLKEYYEES